MSNIVIYGGSFDPIHNGHLYPVTDALSFLDSAHLIYVPCYKQPLKTSANATSTHRFEMCRLAINEVQTELSNGFKVSVSSVEIDAKGTSYTENTLQYFQKEYPEKRLFFLLGMDSLLNFTSWHNWQNILEICELIVMRRPGFNVSNNVIPAALRPYISNKIHFVDNKELSMASSEIRRLNDVMELKGKVPSSVFSYIKKHKLYI